MTTVTRPQLLALGLAPRTAELYDRMLVRLVRATGRGVDELTVADVADFAGGLPPSRWSRAQLRSALGAGAEIVGRDGRELRRAVRVPPKPRMVCRALPERAAAALEAAARASGSPGALAVLLGLYGGLRRAEIARLRWEHVDLASGWLAVHGKGDRFGRLPLHPVLAEQLRRRRRFAGEGPLFPGRWGDCCTPTTIGNLVRAFSAGAGVPCPPHVLRHTCLASLNDATRDLRAVQELARHARPETTAGYTRVRDRRMVETLLRLDYGAIAAAAEAS